MEIILVRHGKTTANQKRIYSNDDVRLSEEGKLELKKTAEILKKYKFDKVYLSELARTKESYDHLNIDMDFIKDSRINEFDFGVLKGHSYTKPEFSEIFDAWFKNPDYYRIPEGESLEDLFIRCKKFYNELLLNNEDVLLVSHNGPIRALISIALDAKDIYHRLVIDNASVSVIQVKEGYSLLKSFNMK